MCWALVAHTMGIECPTFGTDFGHYISKLRCNYALALNGAKCCFCAASMIHSVILYAAFMILLVKLSEKSHSY